MPCWALLQRHLRVLVFPEDELSSFNCGLALLLRHSLVDLYRPGELVSSCKIMLSVSVASMLETRAWQAAVLSIRLDSVFLSCFRWGGFLQVREPLCLPIIPIILALWKRPKFQKLGVVLWQFDRLVEGFLPKVHAALTRSPGFCGALFYEGTLWEEVAKDLWGFVYEGFEDKVWGPLGFSRRLGFRSARSGRIWNISYVSYLPSHPLLRTKNFNVH